MNASLENKCPICNCEQFVYVATCTDCFTTLEKFDIIECKKCKLKITKDAPNSESIGRYYQSNSYISHSNNNKGLINRLYHKVRTYMLRKKVRLIHSHSQLKNGKALDFGAGIGLFVQEMVKSGWSCIGIEKSQEAREYAKTLNNTNLQENSYWSSIEDDSLDVITMWHVLEHIEELDTLWQNINLKLKEKGLLVIAIPNVESFDAIHYKGSWAAYDVPRHLWHFSEATFKKLVSKYNFKVDKVKRMPFDGFYISMMSEKNNGSKLSLFKGFAWGVLGYIQSLFNTNKSSSLIYFLTKNEQ